MVQNLSFANKHVLKLVNVISKAHMYSFFFNSQKYFKNLNQIFKHYIQSSVHICMNIHAMNPKVGLPPTTIQPLQCVRRSKSEQIYQTSGLSNYTEEVQLSWSFL